MAQPEATGSASSRYHHPQLDDRGRCAKKIRKAASRSEARCNEPRDGEFHLYYPCLAEVCARRFWSIEARLIHMESNHP